MAEPVYWNMDCNIALLKGTPILLIGAVLCATVILLPIGIIVVLCSGIPLARVQKRLVAEEIEEEFRERDL